MAQQKNSSAFKVKTVLEGFKSPDGIYDSYLLNDGKYPLIIFVGKKIIENDAPI